MVCYVDRAARANGWLLVKWFKQRRQWLIDTLIGRYEAQTYGVPVTPSAEVLADKFNHGSYPSGGRTTEIQSFIERVDALARSEYERANAADAGPPADAGGA